MRRPFKFRSAAFVVGVIGLLASPAFAAFNERMAVQGYLKSGANPLTTGVYNMRLILRNNGTAVWTKSYTGGAQVAVSNGLFAQILSGADDAAVNFSSNFFVVSSATHTVTVDVIVDTNVDGNFDSSDANFANIDLTPVALANVANVANSAATLAQNGAASGDILRWSGSAWAPASLATSIPASSIGTTQLQNSSVDLATKVTGTLPIARGGTGATSASTAFAALSPLTTKGDLLVSSGSASVRQAVGTNGQVLIADSAQANGVRWGSAGGISTINATAPLSWNSGTSTLSIADGSSSGHALRWNGSAWVSAQMSFSDLSGSINISQGGTGATSFTANQLVVANGAGNALTSFAPCSPGQVLDFDGSGVLQCRSFGGDVTGTPTAITVTKIQGRSVSSSTPSAGDVLQYTGASWAPSGTVVAAISHSAPILAGGATAYTLTTTPSVTTPPTGMTIRFQVNVTNAASPTLALNGGSAIGLFNTSTNAALVASDMIVNEFLTATYNGTNWLVDFPPKVAQASIATCAVTTANTTGVCATTITLTGARTNHLVSCSQVAALPAGYVFGGARVSAANTVSLTMGCNNTAACTWAATAFRCALIR